MNNIGVRNRILWGLLVYGSFLVSQDYSIAQGRYQQRNTGRMVVAAIDSSDGNVEIAAGKNAGIKLNRPLCFFRRDRVPLGCHKVVKVTAKRAWVLVPMSVAEQLSPGAPVTLGGRGSAESGSGSSSISFFHIGYIFGLFTPHQFNKVKHSIGSIVDQESTPWQIASEIKSNPAQFLLATQVSFLDNLGLSTGIIGRISAPETYFSGTYPTDEEMFTEHQLVTSAIGIPLTLRATIGSKKAAFVGGGGLQVDYSQVKFKAWQVNNESGSKDEIANYLSTLTTLGVRIDLGGSFTLRHHQLSFMLGLIVPATRLSRSSNHSSSLPGLKHPEDPGLEDSIGHKESDLGVDLGVVISLGS